MKIPLRKCKYCGVEKDPREMIGVVPTPTEIYNHDTGFIGKSFYYCNKCGEDKEYLHIKD